MFLAFTVFLAFLSAADARAATAPEPTVTSNDELLRESQGSSGMGEPSRPLRAYPTSQCADDLDPAADWMEADTNEEACVGKSPASMVEASPFEDIGFGASLPPFVSDPGLAPILEPRNKHKLDSETRSIPAEDRPGTVIKTIVGLLLLMFLAYLGGHKQVLQWERRLGIAQVITAGLPFIVLGMIARMPSVGILTDPILTELSPVLRIGLSSVGFVAGFRFNANKFHGLPKGTASVTALVTLLPAATVVGATAPLLLLMSSQTLSASLQDPVFIRDALILATCGAMTARSAVRWLDAQGQDGVAGRIIRLEELAGVLGIAFVASFFRPEDLESGWQIPYVGWFLITIGLGATLGIIFYSILQWTPRGPDFLAMTLGAISFAAGAAGYLHLSSVAVAFIAGVMLANFPGTFQPRLLQMLKRLERPIYLVSLFVIGALWQVDDWRGWALMPVFMASRLFGKWLAATVAGRRANMPVTAVESRALAISPIGTLAIAIVVNAQLLYPGGSISLIVSAVIGGGVLTEAFVQLASRSSFRIAHLPYDHPLYVPMADMDSGSEMPAEKRP